MGTREGFVEGWVDEDVLVKLVKFEIVGAREGAVVGFVEFVKFAGVGKLVKFVTFILNEGALDGAAEGAEVGTREGFVEGWVDEDVLVKLVKFEIVGTREGAVVGVVELTLGFVGSSVGWVVGRPT